MGHAELETTPVSRGKRYSALLVTLIALTLVVPAVDHTIYGEVVFRSLLTLIIAAAVWDWRVKQAGRAPETSSENGTT